MEKEYLLANMTWQEVEKRLEDCDIALVPLGSTEQHGPALPVSTDHFIATQFAHKTAETVWDNHKVVVTPPITFGFSPHHMEFKGTITLSELTLSSMIADICHSLAQHGFKKIVIVNGHGGNETAISNALHDMHGNIDAKVYHLNWYDMAGDKIKEIVTPPVYHACDMETSVAWYLGQRVLEDKRVDEPGKVLVPGFIIPDGLAPPPRATVSYSFKEITESGVVGYSTKATKEKGKLIADLVLERLVSFIKEIGKM
ncbi:MAG: creatininase family protein [Candidatus Thorarchaeota archaeon]|nr:creatininase family protein [Candidatus Thorarchaeota archaeon]